MIIMDKFLKAKHWQIFLLTFGFPFILQIILMPVMIITNNPTLFMTIMPIISLLCMVVFFIVFILLQRHLRL